MQTIIEGPAGRLSVPGIPHTFVPGLDGRDYVISEVRPPAWRFWEPTRDVWTELSPA
jgi:hypothetical protein